MSGLPWNEEEFQYVGRDALTANILCERHNNRLSPLDSFAGEVAASLKQIFGDDPPIEIEMDGLALERWVLKTAINAYYGQDFRFGAEREPWPKPSKELVERAFNMRVWPRGVGLHVCGFGDASRTIEPGTHLSPLFSTDDELVGTFCFFYGLVLQLWWGPAPAGKIGLTAREFLNDSNCEYHPAFAQVIREGRPTRINFSWGPP